MGFKKGHKVRLGDTNPNAGRKPDSPELQAVKKAMRDLDEDALRVIGEALKSQDEKLRAESAFRIYTFNHGKPKESMDITGMVGVAPLTGDRFMELYREMKNEADQPAAITANVNEGDKGLLALPVGE